MIGLPIIKEPTTRADKVNKSKKAIGPSKSLILPKTCSPFFINQATPLIYTRVANELIKLVLCIVFTRPLSMKYTNTLKI